MQLRSLPTMEHISVPVRRHPQHSFVQRSGELIALVAVLCCRVQHTKAGDISVINAVTVTALLRECHTLIKGVTAQFTHKAASLDKAVIVLWHTTAVIERPLL